MTNSFSFDDYLNAIRDNKFIPAPPANRIFTGSGEFRQIGVDAVRALVQQTDLTASSRVLEIGSGIGRVALPLTQVLKDGSYTGIDIVMSGVAWCHEHIEQLYGNFNFLHFDIYNEFYNPNGKGSVEDTGLPFESNSFDVVFLLSVFTHLAVDDVRKYLSEIKRVLVPGGKLWGTWFIVEDNVGDKVLDGRSKVPLHWTGGDGIYYTNENKGTLAVAYKESVLTKLVSEAGFSKPAITFGDWLQERKKIDGGFQDSLSCSA